MSALPTPTPPPLVLELARQVNGVPLDWNIQQEQVTIIMIDGRKLTFERTTSGIEAVKPAPPPAMAAAQAQPKRKEKKPNG